MKKRMIKFHGLLCIFTFVVIASCSDEGQEQIALVTLPSISFDGMQAMLNYGYEALGSNSAGRLASAKGVQVTDAFVSMNEVYRQALGELDKAETLEQHDEILTRYGDVISLNSDSTYVPTISNSFYRAIANRKGIYISEGIAHRVFDSNWIIQTSLDNQAQLETLTSITQLDKSIFTLVQYTNIENVLGGRNHTSCGTGELRADYFRNMKKCKDDRRVWVRAYTERIVSGVSNTPYMISEAWGEIRSGVFCRWKTYDTEINSTQSFFTVTLSINGGLRDYPITAPAKTTYGGDHVIFRGNVGAAVSWAGGSIPSIQFTRVITSATSRGVGAGNFAVLNCQ